MHEYTFFETPLCRATLIRTAFGTNIYDNKIYMRAFEALARSLITSDDVRSSTTLAATDIGRPQYPDTSSWGISKASTRSTFVAKEKTLLSPNNGRCPDSSKARVSYLD